MSDSLEWESSCYGQATRGKQQETSIQLSIHSSICASTNRPIHLSIHLSIGSLSIGSSTYQCISSLYPFSVDASVYLSTYLSINRSAYVSVYLSVGGARALLHFRKIHSDRAGCLDWRIPQDLQDEPEVGAKSCYALSNRAAL